MRRSTARPAEEDDMPLASLAGPVPRKARGVRKLRALAVASASGKAGRSVSLTGEVHVDDVAGAQPAAVDEREARALDAAVAARVAARGAVPREIDLDDAVARDRLE